MHTPRNEEEIEDGEFEEIFSAPDVIKITDLSESEIKLIEESEMDSKHNHLNDEMAFKKAVEAEAEAGSSPPMSKHEIYEAITSAYRSGAIDSRERNRMMKTMGVSKNDFVKSKVTKSSKVKKRKSQKAARRNNRK